MSEVDDALSAAVDVKEGWTQPWQHVRVLAAEVLRLKEEPVRAEISQVDVEASLDRACYCCERPDDSPDVSVRGRYLLAAEVYRQDREIKRLRAELADCRKGFVKAKPEWSET